MQELIIYGAKYLLLPIAMGAVFCIWYKPEARVRMLWLLAVSLPLGYALARLAGLFFSHPQPFAVGGFEPLIPHDIDNSFPSDHTIIGGVFASAAFLADRRFGLCLWALTIIMGLCRIAAGLHYPVDIIASCVLAVAAVWVAGKVLQSFKVY